MPQYPIERYLNIRMAYGAGFNGDNNTVVFLTNITGMPQAWQVTVDPDGRILWPQPVTFAKDRVMQVSPSPAAGDYRVIFAHDVGGNENAQLFLLDPRTGEEQRLTDDDDAMHIFGHWAPDGSRFSFTANSRHKGLFDAYVQMLDGTVKLVYRNDTPGYLYNGAFSPDGKRLLVQHTISSSYVRLLEITVESGEARLVAPDIDGVDYRSALYIDDKTALIITDKDRDFLYVARLNLAAQSIEPLISLDWDVEEIALSHDKQILAYRINANGISEVYVRDMHSGTTKKADLGSTPGIVEGMSFSSDAKKLLFTANRTTRSADIYLWNLDTDQVRPITQSSHAGLPQDSFAAPELVHFPTFDHDTNGHQRQIPAWLYKPANSSAAPFPVVMYVHGGPESQAVPSFMFFFQYLVNNGYAVFVPNVRGSTGYGKAYGHLDDVRKRMDSVKDLAYGADWIKQQADLDGDRLAIYGRSYGGFMVLSAVTTYPDLWVAAVDVVGISNFVTFLENTSEYRRAHREAEYGSLAHDRDFLESISPGNHLDKVKAPLLVMHGANDPRVPVTETYQLVETLEKRGVPVELLVFDDEGHQFSKLKNQLVEYPRVVEFLAKYIFPD